MARYTTGPAFGLSLTVAAVGTSVNWGVWVGTIGLAAAATGEFPDNCHTVLIHNTHATRTLLVGSNVLELAGAVTQGCRVEPGTTMTIPIGSRAHRVNQRPKTAAPAQLSGFVFDAIGGAVTADVTFICGIES